MRMVLLYKYKVYIGEEVVEFLRSTKSKELELAKQECTILKFADVIFSIVWIELDPLK